MGVHDMRGVGRWVAVVSVLGVAGSALAEVPRFMAEQHVQAGGVDIVVTGYSVPSYADWNGDGRGDLIVGEGGTVGPAKVRVYLNEGTATEPVFTNYFYAQTVEGDLSCMASGCLGVFPRLVDWGGGVSNLLAGQSDGRVRLFVNVGSVEEPVFDLGTLLVVGEDELAVPIDVGSRATPTVVDWDDDGVRDLVVGALDGKVHLFINTGTDDTPEFIEHLVVAGAVGDLVVPSARSSPEVVDLDGDGKKDLLTGNTNGQVLFYSNVGDDADPVFGGYEAVEAAGVPIDLAGTPRSRPFVCYWNAGALPDMLVGAGDGLVRLYLGRGSVGDMNCDGAVDYADIDRFVQALLGAAQWPYSTCAWLNADCNGDGQVNYADIDAFVAVLSAGA